MDYELQFKIFNDKKLYEYLVNNSNWYKHLNRSKENYKLFITEYKSNQRIKRADKVNDAIDTLDTVNSIFSILK